MLKSSKLSNIEITVNRIFEVKQLGYANTDHIWTLAKVPDFLTVLPIEAA